jgi:hypothetical protein
MKEKCKHENKKYIRSDFDWFDGDEDEVYECEDCGEIVYIYIPR